MTSDEHVVSNQGVLDLSHLTSAEELAGIGRIEDVGLVVVPESLAAAYAAIPAKDVGSTVYVASGANIRVHTGLLEVSGDGIGAAEDVLVVVGMLLITSEVTAPLPRRIHVVGSVLAPRGSAAVLAPALASGTGQVTYYQHAGGQSVRVRSGQVKLSASMLANAAGMAEDLLIVAGQAMLTEVPGSIGYQRVIVAGQLIAPETARDMLDPKLDVQGQAFWYAGDSPRLFLDDVTLGPDFFRLLDGPATLIIMGDLTLTPGVTEAVLREKVTSVYLMGDATVPAELVGMLQVLTTELFGTIRAADGPGD